MTKKEVQPFEREDFSPSYNPVSGSVLFGGYNDGSFDVLEAKDRPAFIAWLQSLDSQDEPSGDRVDALQDRAYCNGAQQALAMAHQSLTAADKWFNEGCGGRAAPARAVLNRPAEPT